MERTTDDIHVRAVDAWLIRASRTGSAAALIESFAAALAGIWARAVRTLGSVTLDAVANRVLANAIERHRFLENIGPSTTGRFRCDELQLEERLAGVSYDELLVCTHTVLVDLLSLLGHLTAGILTPELHAELARMPQRQLPAPTLRVLAEAS